ncbi:hypothetical protein BSL78_25899 [Apostichopus japonicus]|uniref:Fibronectin type-III domain-containing protein n=1 Tax=Stichopus japonicus TaxID=307972 RepID=A0A2G8JNH7_STIJA|nr:hypothetical protein BSL78_25899 [Apostichopus japonicus]
MNWPVYSYEFRLVVAADGIFSGYGPPTGIYRKRIPCGVPTAPSLGISSQNDSSAILNVAVPRHEDWSCANRTIRLHRREMNSATWELRKTFYTIPTLIPETGLRACTTYQYQVNITASIGENSMHSEGSDVQSGLTEIGSEVLNVTTIAASGEEGFTVTLPPLTQKYATNYVIVCSISGGNSSTHHNLGVLNKSDVEITFSLNAGNLTQMIRNTQYSRNPNIFVGVKSNCGESDCLQMICLSLHRSCVTIAVIILLSAFTSIMAYRCSQDGWNYKRAEVDRDGSDYHALEKRQTSSLDRYMPLKIKAPPEKKLTSVTSLSKLTGNSPAEDGEGEPYSKTLDLILFGQSLVENGSQEISIDPSESNGNVEKEDTDVRSSQSDITSSANVLVNGLMPETADNMQHSNMVTRSNDVTTREGSLADVRHLTAGNKAVVQKAVAKFKSAMPQVYSSEIYDQSSTAEIMNSQSVKNRDHSEDINGLNSSVSCGNMITQSYDKVIVTNESQIVKMRKKVTLSKGDLRNHRLSCSTSNQMKRLAARSKEINGCWDVVYNIYGKERRDSRGSYIDVNEVGTPQYISPGLLGTPSTNKENIERAELLI